MKQFVPLALILSCATPLAAQDISLPTGAKKMHRESSDATTMPLPIGPFAFGEVPKIWADGNVIRQSWRLAGRNFNTTKMLAEIKNQLVEQGWDILFECKDNDCGGFDFRFNINVINEPDMHVNLGDFLYLSAQKEGETYPSYVSILISRNAEAGYLQITNVVTNQDTPNIVLQTAQGDETTKTIPTSISTGRVVLEDLMFQPGSADLSEGDYSSLTKLATQLTDNLDQSMVLVGHTDAVGALDVNISISTRRAQSVMQRLIEKYVLVNCTRQTGRRIGG